MTSKDTGASEHALIELIYQHLKENGYKKAASALKKHAPQVETTNVKVSLDDIFKKWVSEEREKKSDEGKDPQTSSESATNAAHNTSPEKKVKSQKPAAARNQKRKRTETKTHKSSSAAEGQTTEHSSTSPTTREDSDSDSSLDVEKWKKLAVQLSDADIAKMDAFTNFSTSTAKSTKKRKPAERKKKQAQTIGNGKRSPKKTKDKTATSPTKTDKIRTPLKPTAFSICESDKDKTPSNKDVLAEPNVKSPESKMATSLSDQAVTPKTGVSNGLSESAQIKVKSKKTHSLSEPHNIETPRKMAETEKPDDISEPKPTDTPCKKTKSKKDVKVTKSGSLETPSRVTDPEVAIQKSQCGLDTAELSESNSSKQSECVLHSQTSETKAKKDKSKKVKIVGSVGVDTSIQTDTEDATGSLTSDQSKINQVSDLNPAETPSKKAKSKKSKKSKEPQEPGDVAVPSGEWEIEVHSSQSKPHQTETLSTSVKDVKSVGGDEPVEKQSKKAKKSLLESNGTEKNIETQADTSILEPLSSETPSKKSKTKKASEADHVDSPSKKAVVDGGEGEAMKSSSSKSDHNDNLLKKSKRKRADSSGVNVTSSGTEHVSKSSSECDNSGVDNGLIPAGNGSENQGQESVSAVEEEETPEPKKRKKNKKDKEKKKNESDENVEEVPSTPPAEEFVDSLPSSQKKKKKKKQKHRDEEMPPVSTPAPEEDSPKKKKKSSKEKEHADVSEQGVI
ncbi:muscle M-line assembly protein unc-89 [Pangasianodon hypophthalmus]|uniref:muscle M-line assembly protein unc-89 n=1 Tax=Pangasianodon hypophthalmus TaxID=310915 RepID=UPI002307FD0A|nr:muscle M-line assembly protein unc-89 [Pangasianodon hypophthalmus]